MAESLPHRGATFWGSSYCHCSREAQPAERFYKSVHPRSQVHRYKTLYLWWLRSTFHRKNRPCRSFEDPQEVGSETGAHTSSRRETPSSSSSSSYIHEMNNNNLSPTLHHFQDIVGYTSWICSVNREVPLFHALIWAQPVNSETTDIILWCDAHFNVLNHLDVSQSQTNRRYESKGCTSLCWTAKKGHVLWFTVYNIKNVDFRILTDCVGDCWTVLSLISRATAALRTAVARLASRCSDVTTIRSVTPSILLFDSIYTRRHNSADI